MHAVGAAVGAVGAAAPVGIAARASGVVADPTDAPGTGALAADDAGATVFVADVVVADVVADVVVVAAVAVVADVVAAVVVCVIDVVAPSPDVGRLGFGFGEAAADRKHLSAVAVCGTGPLPRSSSWRRPAPH